MSDEVRSDAAGFNDKAVDAFEAVAGDEDGSCPVGLDVEFSMKVGGLSWHTIR